MLNAPNHIANRGEHIRRSAVQGAILAVAAACIGLVRMAITGGLQQEGPRNAVIAFVGAAVLGALVGALFSAVRP